MYFDYFQVSLVFLFSVNCRELPRGARMSSIVVGHTLNPPSKNGGALCYNTTRKRWGTCSQAPPMVTPLLPPCTEDDDDYDIASVGGRTENIPGVNCRKLPPCAEDYNTDYDIASIGGRNENIPGVNCEIEQAQDGGNNFQIFTLLGLL